MTVPESQTFFASVPRHLEALLATELTEMGASAVKQVVSGVEFKGSLALACKACLWSRVANRVLMPLAIAPAGSPEELYAFIRTIDWSRHLNATQTLAVDFFCSNSNITHSQYGALKVKDAVVDQFREATGVRPSVERQQPDVRINVYLFRNRARVSIDLSGTSLHRRGYRADGSIAPLKENLAAALLLAAGWQQRAAAGAYFYDPMCGSGTVLIEAALIASNTAPGLSRDYFGFLHWKGHQPTEWKAIRDAALAASAAGKATMPAIAGSDQSSAAIEAATANIAKAGFIQQIQLHCSGVESLVLDPALKTGSKSGLVLTNPPYGVRMEAQENLGKLYANIGSALRREFKGWHVAVFTGAPGLLHRMRLPLQPVLEVANGDLDCKLMCGDLPQSEGVAITAPETVREADFDANNMFANRLRKNLKHLRNWVKKESISAYRVYDADMPEYAVAVDIYDTDERHVVVQEYQAPAKVSESRAARRLQQVLQSIPDVLQCAANNVHLKVRRRQKGAQQYRRESVRQNEHVVSEGDCRLLVNFEDYLDTGLFLDHRSVRQYLAEHSKNKRFLNLFAYTGTATVRAALGGARETLTLDMSNTYLDWAQRNLELNGLQAGAVHRFERADCLQWLQESCSGLEFDLILLDPPTFSNSARMDSDWDVQRDHAPVLRQAMQLLAPDGLLIFSNNFRRFKLADELLGEFDVVDRNAWSLGRDYQRNKRIHHCWFFRHAAPKAV